MDTSHPKHRLLAPLHRAQAADRDVITAWRQLGYNLNPDDAAEAEDALQRLDEQIANRQLIIDRVVTYG